MVQADTLFLRDLSGRWLYQLTVCDPVLKLTAAEPVPPSARNMRAAFGRILETSPIVIPGGARPTTAPGFAASSRELLRERGMAMQAIQ